MKKNPYVLTGLDRDGVPDAENPEWTSAMFKNAKRGLDGLAELVGEEAVAPLRKAGRPKKASPKKPISFRFDGAVVDHLKQDVKFYNRRIEALIREAMDEGRI